MRNPTSESTASSLVNTRGSHGLLANSTAVAAKPDARPHSIMRRPAARAWSSSLAPKKRPIMAWRGDSHGVEGQGDEEHELVDHLVGGQLDIAQAGRPPPPTR